jgi:hypothetical protein
MKAVRPAVFTVLGVLAAVTLIATGARYFEDASVNSGPDLLLEAAATTVATGPLRVPSENPRYFADATGKPVYLTGSHTWNNLPDIGTTDPPVRFDFDEYLRFMRRYRHNFIRLWRWETSRFTMNEWRRVFYIDTQPWPRTGPGAALDGKPRFDLTKFDQSYFDRMRARAQSARENGIYVSVMLFEGWAQRFAPDGYQAHPFNSANNVNGIDCDPNDDDKGLECFMMVNPAVTRVQEAYVRKVVDTVNDLDNVLYEISNENHWDAFEWERHFLEYVRQYEKTKPKQHPVGLSTNGGGGQDDTKRLFETGADWISPNSRGNDYKANPPVAMGPAVIIVDTDHIWGLGGDRSWVWKSFVRGLNPIFMDPYQEQVLPLDNDDQRRQWEAVRRAMGHTAAFASRLDLNRSTPRPDLASSGYCLANPSTEYLVYLPFEPHPIESARFFHRFQEPIRNLRMQFARDVTVDLSASRAEFVVEWFDPSSGRTMPGEPVMGGERRSFTAPFTGDAVLHLRIAQ